ncbi:hypothetical protein [Salinicola tamaricis]|uniref:hypothetical protein n=1 Tax=Salinicola tamaricis TaxID=1771309 RepID=UPI001F5CC801|nr:hypothetical protein [Salinicola tamaricis]
MEGGHHRLGEGTFGFAGPAVHGHVHGPLHAPEQHQRQGESPHRGRRGDQTQHQDAGDGQGAGGARRAEMIGGAPGQRKGDQRTYAQAQQQQAEPGIVEVV